MFTCESDSEKVHGATTILLRVAISGTTLMLTEKLLSRLKGGKADDDKVKNAAVRCTK